MHKMDGDKSGGGEQYQGKNMKCAYVRFMFTLLSCLNNAATNSHQIECRISCVGRLIGTFLCTTVDCLMNWRGDGGGGGRRWGVNVTVWM